MEEVTLDILSAALGRASSSPTPEDVVAQIKAKSPNSRSLRSSQGSLVAALRVAPDDPDFDLAQWNREWAVVEGEMKAVTRANDVAEGRR